MRWQRVVAVSAVAVALAGCSSEKKVGSAIDVEKLAEKNQALGGAKLDKKKTTGGFVGDTEKKAQEQAQQAAAAKQESQNAAAEAQKDKAAVAFVDHRLRLRPVRDPRLQWGPGHGDEPLQGSRKCDGRPG